MERMRNAYLDARLDAYKHEAITISSTAVSIPFSSVFPDSPARPAERAIITVEGDQIRYTYDGTTPTATVGHLANVGDVIILNGTGNIRRFLAIRVTTDATLRSTLER